MCGRYTLKTLAREIAGLFDVPVPTLPLRYNVSPTQPVSCVRAAAGGTGRELVSLRWGLIPHWSEDQSIGNRLINARSETAAEKPAFRSSFRSRRCLVLADGFFEWQATGGKKQPLYITLQGGRPFAFAGLWDRWEGPDGEEVESCTILTTQANELLSRFHDRMPVIVAPEDYARWLDPKTTNPKLL